MNICRTCSASTNGGFGATPCKNGFIQRSGTPDCLKDEIPEHLATDSGLPLFYKEPDQSIEGE